MDLKLNIIRGIVKTMSYDILVSKTVITISEKVAKGLKLKNNDYILLAHFNNKGYIAKKVPNFFGVRLRSTPHSKSLRTGNKEFCSNINKGNYILGKPIVTKNEDTHGKLVSIKWYPLVLQPKTK